MKEIPLETLKEFLDRWHYANRGELSTITLAQTIEYIGEYDFTNIKERLLKYFQSRFDYQNERLQF